MSIVATCNRFIKQESFPSVLLITVTLLALIINNSPLSIYYDAVAKTLISVQVGELLEISKPLLLWVNDGLMAIFFLYVGLEIKRELLEGHLSTLSKIALPIFAAIGGMLVPAIVFVLFNHQDSTALQGWAIPTATDIVFALGILSLLGKRVPVSLKIFLMALATIDDMGAILVISVFYTDNLSLRSIFLALFFIIILFSMNRMNVIRITSYIIIGIFLWISVLKSGVHATLAGIVLAFAIPLNSKNEKDKRVSPVRILEHNLHFWVTYLILPLFAFLNAGVDLRAIPIDSLFNNMTLGIVTGLFFGKQLGVMFFVFIAVKFNIAKLPKRVSWWQIYGIAILTGVGFTMSLFISSLAFEDPTTYMSSDRLAILIGSFLSGIVGYLVLRFSRVRKRYFDTTNK